jgi:hypothetical protein
VEGGSTYDVQSIYSRYVGEYGEQNLSINDVPWQMDLTCNRYPTSGGRMRFVLLLPT